MNKPGSNFSALSLTLLALVGLLIALIVPEGAVAQDPSVDQYAPTTPDAGGATGPASIPNTADESDSGGGSGGGGPAGSSSPSGGGRDDSGSPASGQSAPVAESTSAETIQTPEPRNKAERDLANIAAGAEQQRAAATNTGVDTNAATELLRSDGDGGPGMGIFLWVFLGATLVWAVASGVIRHRRDGQPA